MFRFKFRYCEARMAAFLNGELPIKTRQRVARYIDECPDCYTEYLRQRELHDELTRRLPTFGSPRLPQLERIWAGIASEMQAPPAASSSWQYGLVTLVLLLALLLPVAILGDGVASVVTVTQPTPGNGQTDSSMTSAPIIHATQVAAATLPADMSTGITIIMPEAVPQRTPQPGES